MDEFYPISSRQHNSFCNYVKQFYIQGFGIDPTGSLFIDSDRIGLPQGKHFSEVFPDSRIDLSLRYREPVSAAELLQQQSIFAIDNWCTEYEVNIREMGASDFSWVALAPMDI
jgi:glucosamine-6-phosphate deaminase